MPSAWQSTEYQPTSSPDVADDEVFFTSSTSRPASVEFVTAVDIHSVEEIPVFAQPASRATSPTPSKAASTVSEVASVSDTSTLVWDHEAFETYKNRVLDLANTILKPNEDCDIAIERLCGGGFNRIIGISITGQQDSSSDQFICRIPRLESAQMNRDLAPLMLLHRHSTIQVPEIIMYDLTPNNALGDPYMIQNRIPGVSLFPTYPSMPHETKCAIAEELGNFFYQMHCIESTNAGRLTLSNNDLMILPFVDSAKDHTLPHAHGPAVHNASETLIAALKGQQTTTIREIPDPSVDLSILEDLITIVREMADLGLLDDDRCCICHLDLEPRNILARDISQEHPTAISAVLDWDSSVFAPRFMSCAPPMWLWAWADDDDENEKLANATPATPEMQKIKKLFEDAAGPIYKRFAYGAEYRIARRLTRLAMDGIRYSQDFYSYEELLAEWNTLAPDLRQRKARQALHGSLAEYLSLSTNH